jgi:hypothetical protein
MFEFFERFAPEFWGPVAAALVAISGVAYSFYHERMMRKRDREFDLRKEIYLDAAEVLSIGAMSISKLANIEIGNDKVLVEYQERAPAIAKLQLVAGADTWKAVSEIMGELSSVNKRV